MLIPLLVACADPDPVDFDRDGHLSDRDCDDNDASVHPGAREYCDGLDNDCDGEIDGAQALGQQTWYEDDDGDGYGDPESAAVTACQPGPAWSRFPTDCDDADPSRHPDQGDDCDGIDDNCDGTPDNQPLEPRFVDADGDGFGDGDRPASVCEGSAPNADDCDDDDPSVHPGALEICDGIDGDCDRRDDAIDAVVDIPTWYADLDGDGFGIESVALQQCVPPGERWGLLPGDCDDLAPDTFPGAVQRCTSRDTDCDGQPGDDFGWFAPEQPWRARFDAPVDLPAGTPLTFSLDIAAALERGPVDLASVTVVVQRCDEDEARALPAAASDTLHPWLAGGDPGAVADDGWITVAVAVDEPIEAGAMLAVYLGGPAVSSPGSVVASETSLQSELLSLSLDPDRGGLIDELAAGAGLVRVGSQADARDGNGLETDGSWTQLGPVSTEVLLSSPAVGVLKADGVHGGPAHGDLRYTAFYSVFHGVPAVYVTLALSAEDALLWDGGSAGVRPFDLVPLDLVSPQAVNEPGWSQLFDDQAGVALSWTVGPSTDAAVSCTEAGCSATGTEGLGPVGAALPGETLLAHRVLALVPYLGAVAPALPPSVEVIPSELEAR